jgi:hypothetical protein
MMFKLLKKHKEILLIVLAFGLLLPSVQPAYALPFIGDFLNYTQSAMSGLADLGGWTFAVFTFLFLALGISWGLVSLSASLLEWSIKLPVQLQGNPVVENGWQFTLGLTNLFIVLVFLGIALAFILKTDTYGMKKALPRLIAVALLVNFSLLFVGILADVSTIFQNTLLDKAGLGGGDGLVSSATQYTMETTRSYVNKLIALAAGSAALLAIPGVDVISMIARIGLFLAFTPQLVYAFFLTFFNIILTIIYLFYFVLFIGRIIVFWILGILAPLAFLAFILPGTKKYFDQWLRTLISWTFLGIIALFLLVVGLQLMTRTLGPWLGIAPGNIAAEYVEFWKYLVYYLFLSVYLIFVLFASKKLAPKGTEVVWDSGQKMFGGSWRMAGERLEPMMKRAGARLAERRMEKTEGIAAKMEVGQKPTFGERLRAGVWARRPEKVLEAGLRFEARAKRLKTEALDRETERVMRGAPKDKEARKAYVEEQLLKETQKIAKGIKDIGKIGALTQWQAKEGKIGPAAAQLIKEAVQGGADPDLILARRPDLAEKIGRTVTDTVRKMDPKQAREKIQIDAYKDTDVVKEILKDRSKFEEITKNASMGVRREISNTIAANRREFKQLRGVVSEMINSDKWPLRKRGLTP